MNTRGIGITLVMVASLQAVAFAEDAGTLIIKSNAEGGTVFVDDAPHGTIRGGKARLSLPEGRYRIAIEATGFTRKELGTLVNAGERTLQTLSLEGAGATEVREPANPWRPAFVASAAATAGAVGAAFYAHRRMQGEADQIEVSSGGTITGADCGRPGVLVEDRGGHFASACTWRRPGQILGYAAAGLGGATLVTAYMAFVRERPESRRSLAVTPTVSPDGAGGSVQLAW